MDAIQLLKADHKKVKELLAELAKTTTRAAKTRSELLAQIRVDLEVHTTIEEEIFYPAFRKAGTKDDAEGRQGFAQKPAIALVTPLDPSIS
ncbi:hemerythrin domain-containing protein [Rhodanobacter sp. UC4450_H17]